MREERSVRPSQLAPSSWLWKIPPPPGDVQPFRPLGRDDHAVHVQPLVGHVQLAPRGAASSLFSSAPTSTLAYTWLGSPGAKLTFFSFGTAGPGRTTGPRWASSAPRQLAPGLAQVGAHVEVHLIRPAVEPQLVAGPHGVQRVDVGVLEPLVATLPGLALVRARVEPSPCVPTKSTPRLGSRMIALMCLPSSRRRSAPRRAAPARSRQTMPSIVATSASVGGPSPQTGSRPRATRTRSWVSSLAHPERSSAPAHPAVGPDGARPPLAPE